MLAGPKYSQIGWVVDDLDAAVEKWRQTTHVGPIFVGSHMGGYFTDTKHRGRSVAEIDISTAIAQAGPVQIELIQQHGSDPSPYRDVFAEGESGLHHICTVVDDVETASRHYESLGYDVVLTSLIGGQTPLAYVDTRPLIGCMTELMGAQGFAPLLFSATAKVAEEWDGITDPIRDLADLLG